MNEVKITGLKVVACHGVLPQEKTQPQPFLFDITLLCDNFAAAHSDDIADTVNYAEVCALVTNFCTQNSFNLIETLCHGAANKIMQAYPSVQSAQVVVHKPNAPVGLPFADISVSACVERNTVILSLGSSEGDKKANLNGAISALNSTEGLKVLKVSSYLESEPYGGVAQNAFINCAVLAECILPPRALLQQLHKIEQDFGRVRTRRWADRTLDIDIVFFGNKIIAEEGLCIPHPDYVNRPFVLNPVKEIAPNFVCPLTHKRLADL